MRLPWSPDGDDQRTERTLLISALGGLGLLAIAVVTMFVALPRRAGARAERPVMQVDAVTTGAVQESPASQFATINSEAPNPQLEKPSEVPPPISTPDAEAKPGAEDKSQIKLALPIVTMKRMHTRSSREYTEQFSKATPVMLDTSPSRAESIAVIRATATNIDAGPALLERRSPFFGMPFRRGPGAHLSPDAARHLAKGAEELQRSSANSLAEKFATEPVWSSPERMGAMMQVMMAEDELSRFVWAKHLAQLPGERSASALVRIALFDPAPEVRQQAVASLRKLSPTDYQPLLLLGMEYPWVAITEHAAEALVELRRTDAVPALVDLLDRPEPQAPYVKGTTKVVREVVRVDHKRNCLMCHPVSLHASDTPRRAVPPLKDPLGGWGGYGMATPPKPKTLEVFVRADVTYLKQDYSVMLNGRRTDLFARERPATIEDSTAAQARKNAGQTRQQAVHFALRELTGVEPEPNGANWRRLAAQQR